jgi:hypothetical protein
MQEKPGHTNMMQENYLPDRDVQLSTHVKYR